MGKNKYLILSALTLSALIPASSASAYLYTNYPSLYAHASPSFYNYYGIHSYLKTPSSAPSIWNADGAQVSMSLEWIGATNTYSDGTHWQVQTGYAFGYDSENNYSYYSTPHVYVEWGPVNNLSEVIYGTQPFNTSWDYYLRWDSTQQAWKVNVNNTYTDYFWYGSQYYPAMVEATAEINALGNGNGPANFANNTYLNSSGAWNNLDVGGFALTKDTKTWAYDGKSYTYNLSGTVNNFTVSK